MLKKEALREVRSMTGPNMRGIMLLIGKTSYSNMTRDKVKDIEYYKVKEEDTWKVCIASEASKFSNGDSEIKMFKQSDMAAVLRHICASQPKGPNGTPSSSCTEASQRTARKPFS